MPQAKPDLRPQWEIDDEGADHKLTVADRRLIRSGARRATLTGGIAGALLGVGPWGITLVLRALLGGGWHFDHWVFNLTWYAIVSILLGFPMGWLRRWSCLGHRFGTVPMAGVRSSWNTWLAMAAIDFLVIDYVVQDGLGILLIFVVFGLIWVGLLYDLIWAAIHDAIVNSRWLPAPGAADRTG